MTCIICFLGGIQMCAIGVIGEYIGKIHLETKHRPRYIINLLKNKDLKDFVGYLFVGGLATIVEWICFRVLCVRFSIQYLTATTVAYIISTFANWLFGRIIVFRDRPKDKILQEILSVYAASVVGLLLNLAIMYCMVDLMSIHSMISKVTATILVFIYNYLIRKLLIYRK